MENNFNIVVSICVMAYNHEKYIKQTVESILCQKTNFKYEIIVGDDASTDRTQEILKTNFGDVENVRLVLREKNAKGRNGYLLRRMARGKYIWMYDGDDYWIGDDVLQKCVEWMENHQDYVGITARRIVLSERTGKKRVNFSSEECNCTITLNGVLKDQMFDVCATLYKNFYHDGRCDYRSYRVSRYVGDIVSVIYILLHGSVYRTDKIIGVYRTDRITNASSYNNMRSKKGIFEDYIKAVNNLSKVIFENIDYTSLKIRYTQNYMRTFKSYLELLSQIPFLVNMIGLRLTLKNIEIYIKNKIFQYMRKG